ncbi:MAG: HAMP domain-containing histidine kinase [Clostridiales bacterium]|nr:HAMP domain-containing histidine kinase [Clostridiales bacterium]
MKRTNKRSSKLFRRIGYSVAFSLTFAVIDLLSTGIVFVFFKIIRDKGIVQLDFDLSYAVSLFILISVVVGIILTFWLGNLMMSMTKNYITAIDAIEEGDYSVRVITKDIRGYRILSEKFNHMAARLQALDTMNHDFATNFSHEFKTPIVSIRGFAKMVRDENLTEEERREYLDIIVSESERLSELSESVLALSRIENQSELTSVTRINAGEQIRVAISLLDRKWEQKHINYSFAGDDLFVFGDEKMLEQAWINILDNAVKFSPENGSVGVNCRQEGEAAVFDFSNQCKTELSKDNLNHIFDKFYQGDTSHIVKGNGLGLPIVKEIAELHNGTVEADVSEDKFILTVKINTAR